MTRREVWRMAGLLSLLVCLGLLEPNLHAQAPGVRAVVVVGVANVRNGPSTNAAIIGQLRRDATLSLSGRNAAGTWWYGCCVNGKAGWIANSVARATGSTAALPVLSETVPPPASTTPQPTPTAFPEWKGEYFNDINLGGTPLVVRNDPHLDFNWGLGSPDPHVPADNFSVRWTRRVNFAGGSYLFEARTSDGVRIYLDNVLIMNEWRDTQGYPTYSASFRDLSAGWHTMTVEYYERGGIAYATVWWRSLPSPQ